MQQCIFLYLQLVRHFSHQTLKWSEYVGFCLKVALSSNSIVYLTCEFSFIYIGNVFRNHMNFKHPFDIASTWHQCSNCQLFVETKEDLEEHIRSVHFQCKFCSQMFVTALDEFKVTLTFNCLPNHFVFRLN